MVKIRILEKTLVCLSLAACACSGNPNLERPLGPTTPVADLALMPGDAIRLSFSREPDLDGMYTIDEEGAAALPLLGARVLTDRPAVRVKRELKKEYGERIRNQSVQVVYLRRVRVLGAVRNPGLYHVDPTMTFDDAIALAGGASENGDLGDVRVVREGKVIGEELDARRSIPVALYSGDQIYVPKTSWLSRNAAVIVAASISAIGAVVALR